MPGEERGAKTLAPLRAEIDAVDVRIVQLLARRMEIVERVAALKLAEGIPAFLPGRVEEVARNVRRMADEAGTHPDLAEAVWRVMMDWIIAYEEGKLASPDRPPR